MSWFEIAAIVVAGLWAGTINAIVGSGTLVTFPVLIAFGYPPVVATMSNAVGQVFGNVTGTWGYRKHLVGQGANLRRQLPASLAGGIVGSFLLLHLPEGTFEAIVPLLLILAIVLTLTQPYIQKWLRRRAAEAGRDAAEQTTTQRVVLIVATFLIGIYGGYFTAAQGVLLVGVMGALLPESIQRITALKNLLTLVVNVVAAAAYTFVAFHRISWAAAGLIAIGTLVGGFFGARIGQRLPAPALRGIIVVLGVVAVWRIFAG